MPPGPERIGADVTLEALFDKGARPFSVRHLGDILPGCAYARSSPVYLDQSAVEPEMSMTIDAMFGELEEPALALPLVAITEALVFGQGSVVLPDGRLLHESAREFINLRCPPDGASAHDGEWVLPAAPVERLAGGTLLVKRPWYRNYGHWLVDLMPLIPLIARHGIRPDTIVYGEVPDGCVRAMMASVAAEFLPDARVLYMSDAAQLRCETLLYVKPTHLPPVFKHPMAMQLTVDAAYAIIGGEPERTPKTKLYVSRQRTAARRVTNADALEEALHAAGFETVFPEELGLAEQIAAFARAETIVGVKGAGLTNVLFCRPGTELLVLSPANFPDPFFWDLATQRGVRYAEIFGTDLTPDAAIGRSDFAIDIASVRRFLGGERHAAPRRKPRSRSWWSSRR